jgi:lipoprotein-anchoring transpeptidase ErfK/SrfK
LRDAGRASVTLDDLHGRGVLVRRMMRGFYLALDRDFKAAKARWWRTTAGFAVPFERVGLQGPASDFHGSWIKYDLSEVDGGTPPEPNGAAVLVTSGAAVKYAVDPEKKKLTWSAPLPKMTAVALAGEAVPIGGAVVQQTTYGYWVRLADGMVVGPPDAAEAGADKWIDVDTTRQLLVAYEGTKPVFMTLISSGKKNLADPEKNWTTPAGVYAIREKHVTATMDGDVAADGPYSIEDVPWVMYFQGSYALHAAFWHSSFGHPRSHGCVNMAPADARELFFWAEPRLPRGWHGVFATDGSPGTRVVVHESGDKKK